MKEKAGGVEDIHTEILKILSQYILEPLAYIFNLCVDLSVWSDSLKKVEVVPISESKDKSKVENYRPISLSSNVAKIFKK